MKKIIGLVVLFIALGFLFVLNNPLKIGNTTIPALGKLLNPCSGAWQNGESMEDYHDFEINSSQVLHSVNVVFDERMVPHIYAQNLQDALFAQGYVEAYHRLFQMDLSTRASDGRLSEVLGEKLLNYDKKQRRLGLSYAADNAVAGWQKHPELLKNLDAYTAGINHFISNLAPAQYPLEYKLIDFAPQPWTNRHSALLLKAMTQTLAGYEEDIEMSNALRLLGNEDFKTIYPLRNPKDIPVTRNAKLENTKGASPNTIRLDNFIPSVARPRSPEGVGSNNWAISGAKSATGLPILANDPHLGLTLPSVWYEVAITTPDFSAHGVTLLGMPGIMIGFNENIAWGETNVGHDMMDYHSIDWLDSSKHTYLFDGKPTVAIIKTEKYNVKGLGTVTDTVRYTHWGPVVEDDKNLALRWIAHDPAPKPDFMAFVDGMQCNNYDDYLQATSTFYAPAQNFVYADKTGDIGIRINGNIPIKSYGQGLTISSGSKSSDGWQGFVPRDKNPQERNPQKGYVTSANQWSAGEKYPYFYNGNFEAYRGRIADNMLAKQDQIDVDFFKQMQESTYSLEAQEALTILYSYLDTSNRKHPFAKRLKNWDYNYTKNSAAAVYFDSWFQKFEVLLWDEIYSKLDTLALPIPDSWVTINLIEKNKSHKFYDVQSTPAIEDLKYLANKSFTDMTAEIGNNRMVHGEVKNAQILHLLKVPALSETNLIVGGTKHSLNAMQQTFGPSWRMIVALGETPTAYGIYPGGQSGNPTSPFYKNKIAAWANGEYDQIQLATTPSDIKKSLFSIRIQNEK